MATGGQTKPYQPRADSVVELTNQSGRGRVLLVCEHASNFIPPDLGGLGLDAAAIKSHIAWDPGALEVAREMSVLLDATLVASRVSRLVYDCNRPPEAPSAIPARSETYRIPGNEGLSAAARRERVDRYYKPFRDVLGACIDQRVEARRDLAIVTVHSFTPVYRGVRRDVDIGVLHDADSRLADALLIACTADAGLVVRRNQPYGPEDGVTHTLRTHALPRGLLNVMIEIRNDLIADAPGQRAMARKLAMRVSDALAALAAAAQTLRTAATSGQGAKARAKR